MIERLSRAVPGLLVGRKQEGRCICSHECKRALVEECLRLGVSVAELALIREVNANLLRKWIKECHKIVQAAAPSRPIARGMVGANLLAHVLVRKCADCLPLYRQSEIYAREGVEIERSTLADWVGGSAPLLAPLVQH